MRSLVNHGWADGDGLLRSENEGMWARPKQPKPVSSWARVGVVALFAAAALIARPAAGPVITVGWLIAHLLIGRTGSSSVARRHQHR